MRWTMLVVILAATTTYAADDWPKWLGPQGNGISRETGLAEQWESSVLGFMSARLTMVPSSATKAAVRGSRVFFIQKHCPADSSKTNSMPSLAGISERNMRPVARCSGVEATWA